MTTAASARYFLTAADDPYEVFLAGGSPHQVESWLKDEEETISINYTSGTTGNPKGVMHTYRGAYLNALAEVISTGMSSTSAYLWTLPMFHCNGWCFTWGVTAVGGTHVCLRRVDPVTKDFYPHFQWNLFKADSVVNHEMVTYGNIPSLTWLF